jgi:tight adherence protein C
MTLLIAAAVFAIVSGILMSTYYVLTAESPITQRLRAMAPRPATAERETAPRPSVFRGLLIAIGEYGLRRGDNSLAQKLSSAGYRGTGAVTLFLGARTLLSFGPALFVFAYETSGHRPLAITLWLTGLVWGLGHIGANTWLRQRSGKRIRRLTEALPDSLDLMVVCLESGLGLNATIARVGEERAALNDPLGNEFAQVAFEIRSGRSREEALRALGARNGVEDLKALAALIIQSDKLGASMAKTLRAHADLLRVKRRQRAEETARKLPVKVLFPLATMLLPPLFIMVAGPAFLKFKDLVKLLVER